MRFALPRSEPADDDRHPALAAAQAHLDAGEPEAALAVLDEALSRGDGPAGPLGLCAALAEARLGRSEAARSRLLALAEGGALGAGEWPTLVATAAELDLDEPAAQRLDLALQGVLEAVPDSAAPYLARGMLYRARGRLENAINEFDYAAELDENLVEAWLAVAECELAQARPLDAADALDHAADLDPNDIELFLRLGEALLAAGDPTRAIRAFEEGLQLAPNEPALIRGRARAALAMQLFDDALEDAQAAVRRQPEDAEAWALVGLSTYQLGRDVEAVAALDRALALDPDHRLARRTRGDAYWAQRRFAEAAQDYALAAAAAPEDAELALCLAEARFELGDSEAAMAGAGSVMATDPELTDAHLLAARIRRRAGDEAGALAMLDAGLEVAADEPTLYIARARLYQDTGRPYLAWRDLRWAIDLDPGHAEAYRLRGALALDLEGPEEAIADLEAALEIDPNDAAALAWRGRAHRQNGEPDAAEEDWAEADALLPDDDPLRAQIAVWRTEDA
jgi:tetratricopeptide (TPR) repeat protein